MKTSSNRSRLHLGLALSALLTSSVAFAQGTWDGGGTTSNFTEAANWVGDIAPTTNGAYIFAGTVNLTANNNLTLTGADNTITFDATAGAFTLTGNPIRGGAVTNNSSNLQTISVNLRLNGGRTIFTGASGVQLTVLPTSTGGGRTITKTGTGNLSISATGTSTNINYTASAGNLVLNNATGTLTLPGATVLAASTELVLAQAGTANVSAVISGAGSVRKTGAGASSLSGLNTYTGGTTVQNGVLGVTQSFTMAGTNGFSLTGTASPVQGTDYGSLAFSGTTLTYGGDLNFSFSGTAVSGASYNLFDYVAGSSSSSFANVSIGGSYTTSFTNSSGVWSASTGGFNWTFTESTGDLLVTSAVPEPSTFAAIAGLLGLGFAASRRRRTA